MAVSSWLVLSGVLALYVSLGLWAISQIFPVKRGTTPRPEGQRKRTSRT
jgi:hypothetical protein